MSAPFSVTDSRINPNLSVSVNGTLTYTTPSVYSLQYWFDVLFGRTQPLPKDSRSSGVSVQCSSLPQNSRASGLNGPGN